MLRYIGKRALQALIVMFIVMVAAFFLVRMAPGSPAMLYLPSEATPEMIAATEARLGLDKPLYEQFWNYVKNLVQGDLGMSSSYNQPVLRIILQRLPNTLMLAGGTVLIGCLLSIPLGIIAGTHRGKPIDFFAMLFALLGQSMSSMWLGVLLIYFFAVRLGWLPAMGTGGLRFLILPVLSLGYPMAAGITRIARSGMADTLQEDYITATYAKGIGRFKVYTKYALRNAMIPVSTMIGLNLGIFLAGSVVVETVFAWNGIGSLLNQSVNARDYNMVQALLLISAFMFTLINLVVDIINSYIDHRLTLT